MVYLTPAQKSCDNVRAILFGVLMAKNNYSYKEAIIVAAIFAVAIGATFLFREKPEDVAIAAKANDWKSYQSDGLCLLGCDEKDFYMTRFIAIKDNGKEVRGCVCSGLIGKGVTVRYE